MSKTGTAKKKYAYDPECGDLAKYFLPNGSTDETINDLAQAIQNTVEDFMDDIPPEAMIPYLTETKGHDSHTRESPFPQVGHVCLSLCLELLTKRSKTFFTSYHGASASKDAEFC